jgi:hypothetical protein
MERVYGLKRQGRWLIGRHLRVGTGENSLFTSDVSQAWFTSDPQAAKDKKQIVQSVFGFATTVSSLHQ